MRLFEIGRQRRAQPAGRPVPLRRRRRARWGDPASPVRARRGPGGRAAAARRGRSRSSSAVAATSARSTSTTEDGRLTLTAYVWPDMTAGTSGWPGRSRWPRQHPVRVERSRRGGVRRASSTLRAGTPDRALAQRDVAVRARRPAGAGDRPAGASSGGGERRTRAAGAPVRRAHAAYAGGPSTASGWCARDLARAAASRGPRAGWRRTGSRSPGSDREALTWAQAFCQWQVCSTDASIAARRSAVVYWLVANISGQPACGVRT